MRDSPCRHGVAADALFLVDDNESEAATCQ
jgi:hypothetical protein